jgi:glycosyltransferase involved in cell wall biosynthesis
MSQARFNPWLHEYYERFTPGQPGDSLSSVCFVIGSADISGGSYVIFQHALWLQEHGIDVTVVPVLPMSAARKGWHPALDRLRFAKAEELGDKTFDIAIATWWPTVFELPKLRFRHAVYFVQSAEPRFVVDGREAASAGLAELTYTFGLPAITIATWLQMYLAFQHRTPSFLVRNGIDAQRFGVEGPRKADRLQGGVRALVEGAVDVPMKGVQEAVEVAREGGCDEVWLLTPSYERSFPGCDRVFSRIPFEETAEVYRSCDLLVKLSHVEGMYGPPLEMFHCGGTTVTYDVTGHDEYVKDGYNGLVVPVGDREAAIAAVRRAVEDRDLLAGLCSGALETAARWPGWESSSEEFGRILRGISKQPASDTLPAMMKIAGAHIIDAIVRENA